MSLTDQIQEQIFIAASVAALAGILTTIFTGLLYAVAKRELGKSGKVNKEDFANKIKNDFYTTEMYYLFFLVENDLLEFHTSKNSERWFFLVKQMSSDDPFYSHYLTILEHFKVSEKSKTLMTYFFDQYLLNHFTDLESLRKGGIFTYDDIYQGFEYYITNSGKNNALAEYVRFSRKDEGNYDVFESFVNLYKHFNHGKSFLDHHSVSPK